MPDAHVGALLREWRAARRLSQLSLALEVGVSTRRLSCVETGKAQPSRDMVAGLADAQSSVPAERSVSTRGPLPAAAYPRPAGLS